MDSELQIRTATESDLPRVLELVDDADVARQVAPLDEIPLEVSSVRAWMARAVVSVVMERKGRVVAFATLVADARVAGRIWIGHVVLDRSARGLGLGQRFVRGLLRMARGRADVREVRLSVFAENEVARHCYERCGFFEVERRREDGRTMIEMRWRNPDHDRRLGREVAAGVALITTGISAALLPWGARFWLTEYRSGTVAIMLVAAALMTAAWAFVLQPVLPPRSGPLSHRLGRPVLYGSAVGVATALSGWAAMVLGSALGAIHLPDTAAGLLENLVGEGLRHGAVWGVVLLVALDLAPHALGWRRPPGRGRAPRRLRA